MAPQTSLKQRVIDHAHMLGFDAVAVARADRPLDVEHDRYLDFVAQGRHGRMGYLAEHAEERRTLSSEAILPGAKSVICLARGYRRSPAEEDADAPLAKLCARYARGHDYHNHLRKKLRSLAKLVRGLGPGIHARPLLDEEPVLERAWAARAGLGFVGKNGLVIVPGQGSFVLLGEVVTTLELAPDEALEERCGSCTRCLDVCPTQAFAAPFVLDPRRCVAYLTIEDPLLEAPLAPQPTPHLFGCDDCQTVCPFNKGVPRAGRTQSFAPLPAFEGKGLADVVGFDEPAFSVFSSGSPLTRAGRVGLARNALRVAEVRLGPGSGASEEERRDAERARALARTHDDPRVRAAVANEPAGAAPATRGRDGGV